jgi:hypothetical protein
MANYDNGAASPRLRALGYSQGNANQTLALVLLLAWEWS